MEHYTDIGSTMKMIQGQLHAAHLPPRCCKCAGSSNQLPVSVLIVDFQHHGAASRTVRHLGCVVSLL